jgi:hypothetical protein
VATTGSYILLKPGVDFALPESAPGVLGNFTLQVSLVVENTTDGAVVNPVFMTVVPTSGFFISEGGASRVETGILSQADVLSSESGDFLSRMEAHRMIGAGVTGGNLLSSMANALSKAKQLYDQAKPVLSAVRNVAEKIPHEKSQKAASMMKSLGLGGRKGLSSFLE